MHLLAASSVTSAVGLLSSSSAGRRVSKFRLLLMFRHYVMLLRSKQLCKVLL
jgi:hypothetical protein